MKSESDCRSLRSESDQLATTVSERHLRIAENRRTGRLIAPRRQPLTSKCASRLFTLFCGSVITFSLSTAAFAQETHAQEKMGKTIRVPAKFSIRYRRLPTKQA